MAIKTTFNDAIGPDSVPTKATHSPAATTDTKLGPGLPARTAGHGGVTEVTVDGAIKGQPKASGPVKTMFKDAVD
jgi:hypothetical protein